MKTSATSHSHTALSTNARGNTFLQFVAPDPSSLEAPPNHLTPNLTDCLANSETPRTKNQNLARDNNAATSTSTSTRAFKYRPLSPELKGNPETPPTHLK
ncbi:hypothetical protein M758_3G068300 [Ceratodon purpureus]|nr:hypothetical protein M758_3G068300 [Ceratodon purpureus]